MKYVYTDKDLCFAVTVYEKLSDKVFSSGKFKNMYDPKTGILTAPFDCAIDFLERDKIYFTAIMSRGERLHA